MRKKGILFVVLFVSVIFLITLALWAEERPIPLGVSGGNILDSSRLYCCGGTLGALVKDINGVQYILSNNHILARTNLAKKGEDIIQPGLVDQTPVCYKDADDVVADLSKFVAISFKRNVTNKADAAIAQTREGQVDPTGFILNIGQISAAIAVAVPEMAVQKNGRTTGLTKGTINSINTTVKVIYTKTCGIGSQTATFVNQIVIGPAEFSAGGDSGSLIVEDAISYPRAVGLLFAGSSTVTVANPINDVLSLLGVAMVGVEEGQTAAPQSDLNNVIRVKQRHEKSILSQEGVIGIGVGLSEITRGNVIKVYVRNREKMKRLIPETLENIPVEVIETDDIVAF